MSAETRLEALDRAVRISLALGGHDSDETVISRADAFNTFLTTEDS